MSSVKFRGLILLPVFLAMLISPNFSQEILIDSWINELGSVLVIDSIDERGVVFGEYRSSSGVDGRVFALSGFVNSDAATGRLAISFAVRWDGYSSITSWTGFLDHDEQGTYLKTLWHLVRPGEQEPWERIITNSSTFRQLR